MWDFNKKERLGYTGVKQADWYMKLYYIIVMILIEAYIAVTKMSRFPLKSLLNTLIFCLGFFPLKAKDKSSS